MAWLLDTNILSEGRKPKPDRRVIAFYESQPANELFISVINVAEIRFGIELQEDPASPGGTERLADIDIAAYLRGAYSSGHGRHPA